jgi:hypothetical protein
MFARFFARKSSAFMATLVVSLVFCFVGCSTTPYYTVEVSKLTDQQLVDEFAAAAEGAGRQVNKAELLIATKPDPLYVLSSSTTTFFGTSNASFSGYAVPTSYGAYYSGSGYGTYSGVGQTRYTYTDVTALAQLMHLVGAAVASANAEVLRRRGQEVIAEVQRRVEVRRVAAQRPVDRFFAENKALADDKALVTAVLAFIPPQANTDASDQLRQAKQVIDRMQRGPGLAGDWYGVFAQVSTLQDGRKFAMNNFLRLRITQEGNKLIGTGELGTGEKISVDCAVNGDEVTGTVTNTSSLLNLSVKVNGRTQERDKLKLDFSGGSAAVVKVAVNGNVGLFR